MGVSNVRRSFVPWEAGYRRVSCARSRRTRARAAGNSRAIGVSVQCAPLCAYRSCVITWNVHPIRQFPVRGAIAAILIMALGFAIGAVAGDWIWGSISMVILFAATVRFWMRSTFVVDGVRVRAVFPLGNADVRWSDVQSARLAPRGMLLSMRAGTRPRSLAVDFAGLGEERVREIRQIVRDHVSDVESAVPLEPGSHASRETAREPTQSTLTHGQATHE